MTSRSSSPSEGEIVESGSEKATKSLSSANGTSVDRTSRKRVSPSRSPSPLYSPRQQRNRSGSRSPYREARGSKRQRQDDHYSGRQDSRSTRTQYDDRRYDGKSSGRGNYRDLDWSSASGSNIRYDDRGASGRSREKRPRTISRSPPRSSDRKRPDDRHDRSSRDNRSKTNRSRLEVGDREGGGRVSREQSVSERGTTLGTAASSKTEAEQKQSQTSKSVSFKLGTKAKADKYVHGRCSLKGANYPGDSGARSREADAPNGDTPMDSEPLDEAALIEQRRKKREAIKAKHRSQGTPLLVQALNMNNTSTAGQPQPDTPGSATQAIGKPEY